MVTTQNYLEKRFAGDTMATSNHYKFLKFIFSSNLYLSAVLLGLISCSGKIDPNFIGSAIVETPTYQIMSSVPGKIISLYKQEGQSVLDDELVAVIDTIPWILQMQELIAGLSELKSNQHSKAKDIKAAHSDIRSLEKDYSRISPLVKEGSLPLQQEDKLSSGIESAKLKLAAAKDFETSLNGKQQGIEAKVAQVREQIRRCYLHANSAGRILTRYKNLEESTAPGQPIYEIGREDTLQVDFFVPQPMLAQIKYGQNVRLRLDMEGEKNQAVFLPATISWIGNEAEFSPKNIQTRESRNELVFRIRALAANKDGLLKRGLPIEIWK